MPLFDLETLASFLHSYYILGGQTRDLRVGGQTRDLRVGGQLVRGKRPERNTPVFVYPLSWHNQLQQILLNTEKADLTSLKITREHRGEGPIKRGGRAIRTLAVVVLVTAAAIIGGARVWDIIFTKPVPIQLTAVTMRSASEETSLLTASGYIVAQRKAAVASKATGLLVQLNVKEGDKVKANQVIARLQDNDIRALLNEAEAMLALNQAELAEAKNNLDRQRQLAAQGTNAPIDLERSETAFNRVLASIAIANARVEGAKVALENTVIRAPFDGTVLTKNADVGEIVAPMAGAGSARAAVVTIADLGSLEVEADVSEANIEKIYLNARCNIKLDAYPTLTYPGYVASIIPTADRAKGTVLVKIGFKEYDARVLPEMSAKVTFIKARDSLATQAKVPVLTVPESALVMRNDHQVAFKVASGRAVEVQVQAGNRFNGLVEIRNGLKEGEMVIQKVSDAISDGVKVKAD